MLSHLPGAMVADEPAPINQHPDDLFQVERVANGTLSDPLLQQSGVVCRLGDQPIHQSRPFHFGSPSSAYVDSSDGFTRWVLYMIVRARTVSPNQRF